MPILLTDIHNRLLSDIRQGINFLLFHSLSHSVIYFAFNKKYNNSIQKYIKDNIRTIFQLNYYKIKYGKGKEAYIEAGGL